MWTATSAEIQGNDARVTITEGQVDEHGEPIVEVLTWGRNLGAHIKGLNMDEDDAAFGARVAASVKEALAARNPVEAKVIPLDLDKING